MFITLQAASRLHRQGVGFIWNTETAEVRTSAVEVGPADRCFQKKMQLQKLSAQGLDQTDVALFFTKGSFRRATLSFILRSKGLGS